MYRQSGGLEGRGENQQFIPQRFMMKLSIFMPYYYNYYLSIPIL